MNTDSENTAIATGPSPQASVSFAVRGKPDTAPNVVHRRSSMGSIDATIKSMKIMIVDDEKVNVLTVRRYLKREGYENFATTCDSRDAMAMVGSEKPAIVLLDINMPYVSGLEILDTMSSDESMQHIPVIILTASTDPEIKSQALELGANDFISKPIDLSELVPRVRNALVAKAHFDQLADQAARLEQQVQRRTKELMQSRQQLILSLARAAEHRDNETSNHVLRVGAYARIVASELGWSDRSVQMLEQAAQLHDVGKIGIPDRILFKKGSLDPDEYDLIKTHCALGKQIIEPFSPRETEILRSHAGLGEQILNNRNSPMLTMAARIAQTHHEHWNGNGYPLGLAGEDIPVEGRITTVADVYDALSTERPYKKAIPREQCFRILEEGRGTQFDPRILDAFFARSEEIIRVQMDFMDVQGE